MNYDRCKTCNNIVYPPGVTFTGFSCPYSGNHPSSSSTSQYGQSLRDMYNLGVEHGKALAEKDAELKRLQDEIELLNKKP